MTDHAFEPVFVALRSNLLLEPNLGGRLLARLGALDAPDYGGQIDATGKDGRVWIRLANQDGLALVEVGDTGHGMTPEFVRERLFKPFQTTKETGMGIGAYESMQYVQELGGRVEVDSTLDVGTQVRLLLPCVASPADAAAPAQRERA